MTINGEKANGEIVRINLKRWQLFISILVALFVGVSALLNIVSHLRGPSPEEETIMSFDWRPLKSQLENTVKSHNSSSVAHANIYDPAEDIRKDLSDQLHREVASLNSRMDKMDTKLDLILDHMMNGD